MSKLLGLRSCEKECSREVRGGLKKGGRNFYTMENPVSVAKLEASKSHGHPALDICWEKDERAIFDDHFEI